MNKNFLDQLYYLRRNFKQKEFINLSENEKKWFFLMNLKNLLRVTN
ncbi:hypothetical protein [Candidatus Phytoplasma sacchari]|uniref:Uncharacterized protein n=1 Tax=Candidatus Phytoplasma sacchari TaxID=2609813 RepID=A0ABY7M0Q1_9MOLU|nr:hypothetical protein O7R10_01710 [Candidatus Phytoplasma sacchari]